MTRSRVLLVGGLVLLAGVARDVRAQTSDQGSAFVNEVVGAIGVTGEELATAKAVVELLAAAD